MAECMHCRMASLTDTQRAVLLRIVAEGCTDLTHWGSSCTDFTSWGEAFFPATLALACRDLVAKGLLADVSTGRLALYQPTIAGVHLAVAWLHAFIAYPPGEACPHE